jgi:hypothetical protein
MDASGTGVPSAEHAQQVKHVDGAVGVDVTVARGCAVVTTSAFTQHGSTNQIRPGFLSPTDDLRPHKVN